MRTCSIDGCERAVFGRGWCQMHYARWRSNGDPNKVQRNVILGTTEERFWARVVKTGSCWLWTGQTYRNGYGNVWNSEEKRGRLAHRFGWEIMRGPLARSIQLDHICHNRSCVNPDHLRPVTNKQNNENPSGLRSDNTSGYRGVRKERATGRYATRVQHHGKQYTAGTFATAEEANAAVIELRNRLFTHNDADRREAA